LPVVQKRSVLADTVKGHCTGELNSLPFESLVEKVACRLVLATFPNCSLDLFWCKGGQRRMLMFR